MNSLPENSSSAIAGLAVVGIIVAAGVVFAFLQSDRLPSWALVTISFVGIVVVAGILGAVVKALRTHG